MANPILSDVLENIIRHRSYLIWQREGCPDGRAMDHWIRAETEIHVELSALPPLRKPTDVVMPRRPISRPPAKRVSAKIKVSAARR